VRFIRTEKRLHNIRSVINARQPSLKIVIENIHDPHNVSAIFRTCDAAGIPKVSLLYYIEKFPKIGKKSPLLLHLNGLKEKNLKVLMNATML